MREGRERFEVIIVGAGIAGVSLAYFLARRGLGEVLLLEREPQLAYHATGRSAASLVRLDSVPTLLELKALAGPFLEDPPAGFSAHPLLVASGVLNVFPSSDGRDWKDQTPPLRDLGIPHRILSREQALALVPVLAPGRVDGAILLPGDGRLDVHELLGSYLRHARAAGAQLRTGVAVQALIREAGRCVGVSTPDGEIRSRVVVDAAGAWAGRLGAAQAATAIPLVPHRRTMVTFAPPAELDIAGWPFLIADADRLYFAPEAGDLMLSAMDEDACVGCDAIPDDLVVASALDRLAVLAPRLLPRTLRRRWAGLRTFTPDRVPVVGEDPALPGLFWLAGQGGCGIETSPALGAIAADLLVDGRTDRFDARRLAPQRFRPASPPVA